MTLWWTRLVAGIADWFPGGLYGLMLGLLVLAVLIGLAIQHPALYRWRRKKREKPRKAEVLVTETPADVDETVPDLPADALLARAQRFMASGEYRQAVREWLRVMVRDLIEAESLAHSPGMTVTELAVEGSRAVPASAATLSEAAAIFSEIWYGGRSADLAAGSRMQQLRQQLSHILATHVPVDIVAGEAQP